MRRSFALAAALWAAPAAAQEAARFAPGCPAAVSTASWTSHEDPYFRYAAPPDWKVADGLALWTPGASTTTVPRLTVDLDYSQRASSVPALALYGLRVPGRIGPPGQALGEHLRNSASVGHDSLGEAGSAFVAGVSSACPMGVVEFNARRACGGPDVACRRGMLFVDCGTVDGVGLTVTALTPPYPAKGEPSGPAAKAVDEFRAFLCSLLYKGKP